MYLKCMISYTPAPKLQHKDGNLLYLRYEPLSPTTADTEKHIVTPDRSGANYD